MIHHYICINNDTRGRTNSIHSTHLYLFIKKEYPYRSDLLKEPQCSSNPEVFDKFIYRYSEKCLFYILWLESEK